MIGCKILGTGSYVPERIITNQDLEASGISNAAWVSENLGIDERHVVADGQTTSDLAYEASKRALQAAEVEPEDIDLIIVGTTTPDRKAPSTACILQNKLGSWSCPAFDISAACSSFHYALANAAQFVGTGLAKRALVVGADAYSTITDWSHRDAVFFGDAAGAVVLEADPDQEPWTFFLAAEGASWDHFTVPGGGSEKPASKLEQGDRSQFFQLKGNELYHDALRTIPVAARNVLEENGIGIGEIDAIVPHQASLKVLTALGEELGAPGDKVLTCMQKFGNTAAASQALMFDIAVRSGRIRRGMTLLFLTFGAGITYGAALVRY